MDSIDILYSPSEVCDQIKVKDSTLRKYVIILEAAGYVFSRNNKGHRQYTDKDIVILKRFIAASKQPGIRLETAAEQIVSVSQGSNVTQPDTKDITVNEGIVTENGTSLPVLLKELQIKEEERDKQISLLVAINTELINRLEEMDKREKQMIRILEGMEARELEREVKMAAAERLAAADPLDEQEIEEPRTKKNFFSRLLGK